MVTPTRRRLGLGLGLALLSLALTAPAAAAEPPLDPFGDADGDGLSNLDELTGWTVVVDRTGLVYDPLLGPAINAEVAPQIVTVTSDPEVADSDGDGLDDLHERAVKSDPRVADTDQDGLTDLDEVMRWGTSPTSVDTDGDASVLLFGRVTMPDPRLFDAAELRLVDDGDGGWRTGPGATSPLLADTDGDGVGDLDELRSAGREATVAEVPAVHLAPSRGAATSLTLVTTVTDGTGHTHEHTVTNEHDKARTITAQTSGNATTSVWSSLTQIAEASLDVGVGFEGEIVEVGVEVGAGAKLAGGVSNTSDFTLGSTQEVAGHSRRVHEDVNTDLRNHRVEVTGARVRLPVDLVNVGELSVRPVGVTLALTTIEPKLPFGTALKPLATAQPQGEPRVLKHGERQQLIFTADVDPERMLELMERPTALHVLPATMNLVDADGIDFDFMLQAVGDATMTLLLDRGLAAGGAVTRHVAANVDRGADGAPGGVRLHDALEVTGVPLSQVEVESPLVPGGVATLVTVYDQEMTLHAQAAPDLNDPLPYALSGGPGPRFVDEGWFLLVRRAPGHEGMALPGDVMEARFLPGDRAQLIFARDADQDGLPDAEERLRGSRDDALDTDQDGLSDFWEAREGWTVTTAGVAPYLAMPDPSAADGDGDGLTDPEEYAAGTDPRRADTDGDGLSDLWDVDYGDALDGGEPGAPEVACAVQLDHAGFASPFGFVRGRVLFTDAFDTWHGADMRTGLCNGQYCAFDTPDEAVFFPIGVLESAVASLTGDFYCLAVDAATGWYTSCNLLFPSGDGTTCRGQAFSHNPGHPPNPFWEGFIEGVPCALVEAAKRRYATPTVTVTVTPTLGGPQTLRLEAPAYADVFEHAFAGSYAGDPISYGYSFPEHREDLMTTYPFEATVTNAAGLATTTVCTPPGGQP